MTASDGCVERAAIAADLEGARLAFHRLLDATGTDDWRRSTNGTRWTNEQLLFHIVFGYMIVARLLPLVRLLGRLPERVSAGYARLLDAGTVPFHAVNFYGSCAAARVYNRHRMGAKLDRVIAALQRRLARESDRNMHRGMHFPTRWDSYFRDWMTLEDVYRYPRQHFDHHAHQLTFTGTGTD